MGDTNVEIKEQDASIKCTDKLTETPAKSIDHVDEILPIKVPVQRESAQKLNLPGDIGTQTMTETRRMHVEETPPSRRRHVRKNLFEDDPQTEQEIFSYKGKRGVNIQRHQDNVTVFPSGCMGINDKLKDKEDSIISPRRHLNPSEMQVPQTRLIGFTPRKRPNSAQPNIVARNPLTGEGYNDSDFIRQGTLRKKDGNPLLGEGYKNASNTKSGKIPPGGYSTGLW
ncbi:jupiter [Carabus blaptoides fortunei]